MNENKDFTDEEESEFDRQTRRIEEEREAGFYQSDQNAESEGETVRKSGLAYSAAVTLFAAVVLGLLGGYLFDKWRGSSPVGLVCGIVLGAVVGLYQFMRISSSIK